MRIWLLRHGLTEWNLLGRAQGREDIDLNEGGVLQAEDCAEKISSVPITHIVSSPLRRAICTAEPIARKRNLTIEPMEEFTERDFGLLSGKTKDEVTEFHNREAAGEIDLHVESRESVTNRAMEGLRILSERYPDGNVLVVTHGGVISAIIKHFQKDAQKGFLDNVFLTELLMERGNFQLTVINEAPEQFAKRMEELLGEK